MGGIAISLSGVGMILFGVGLVGCYLSLAANANYKSKLPVRAMVAFVFILIVGFLLGSLGNPLMFKF